MAYGGHIALRFTSRGVRPELVFQGDGPAQEGLVGMAPLCVAVDSSSNAGVQARLDLYL